MIHIILSILASLVGAYAYGNNAYSVFTGKMNTSFWGRLIWLGSNSVILMALIHGHASILTIIPMIVNVICMVLTQLACAYRRLFAITKVDIICLIIVFIGLICYTFANAIGGLIITLVADAIGGTLVIIEMFRGAKNGKKPENRRQYVLSAVRNVMMLAANENAPTFLSVFGLAYQTIVSLILAACVHITKSGKYRESIKNSKK